MQKCTLPTLQQHVHVFIAHCGSALLGYYCAIQTIRHPQTFVTGSAKTRHNGASLNFQYRLLIAMGKKLA